MSFSRTHLSSSNKAKTKDTSFRSESKVKHSTNPHFLGVHNTGPHSAVGNVSGCRSRGHKFDPGPVPYFRGD